MFLKPIAVAALSALALAVPLAESETNSTITKRWPGPGSCGDSFFFDRTSDASPSTYICRKLLENLKRDHPSNWARRIDLPNTDELPFRLFELAENDECVFGVRKAFAGPQKAYAVIGTDDVIDLIQDSINRYQRDGRVGSEGAMYCRDGAHEEGVWWGLF